MKTIKQYLEEKGISQEDFNAMTAEQKAELYNELAALNKTAFEELQAKAEKVDAIEEAMKVMSENQAQALKDIMLTIEKQGLALAKVVNKETGEARITVKSQLSENMATIKNLANKISHEEVEIKALTNVASVDSNTWAWNLPDVGQLGTREVNMENLFPTITIGGVNINKSITYWDWDEATIVRAADMVAEGTQFPESTAAWKQYTLPIQKVGDTLPVTEEFMEDESMFASELELFLATNVALEVDDQIVNGDGTGNNLDGLNNGAPAYVPVASGIADASIYDLIVKVMEDITTSRGSKYRPNFVVMNIADINKMKLKKDANNNYVLPPFVSADGSVVNGVVVIENNAQTANTLVLGDNRFARIYAAAGFTLSTGTINDQFTADIMTLKVRRRMAFLMREVDKTGFRKVTDIDAALTTLAT